MSINLFEHFLTSSTLQQFRNIVHTMQKYYTCLTCLKGGVYPSLT